jgi:molybdopterin-guanine dinucleotide biosynthesis protein A
MARAFSAVLLAAGRSQRMGTDKALLECEGRPLWRRQREVLAGAGAAEIFLNVRPEQSWASSAEGFSRRLHDALPDCGPIVGITAALEAATHAQVAALAIDLPRITSEWFGTLLAACDDRSGVVARGNGRFEPLAALYPRELRWLAWEQIARGDYSLQHLLAAAEANRLMRVLELTGDDARRFQNWNRPEEVTRE